MTAQQLTLLISAFLVMAAGVFLRFVEGESTGTVFIAVGATFAAVSAALGASAKKKEDSDAG